MEMTEADLRRLHDAHPQVLIMFDWDRLIFAGNHTYADFADLVERAVSWSAAQLSENPKELASLDENGLTYQFVRSLRNMAFDASLDATVGGHCDLVVKYGDRYMWLAEAKIYTGYKWLAKGYLQLTTRYSTGEEGQDRGGLLIYFKKGNAPLIMREWSRQLVARKSRRNGAGIRVAPSAPPAASFMSIQEHYRSGREDRVKHFAVSIVWEPEV
ncbi:hypothetical protein [Stenotrophomonas sp.]|uniref:hypothetical protein n=1 Tax=Stenotrophomonas sp. TaxID=69392 RepID=UPI0028A7DB68|nr:hypothetical protein [Stenotrophomonas sp.]